MSPSVTRWDGSAFHTLGCGLHGGTWDCITPGNGGSSSPTTDLEFWNGELYACGTFTHSGQTELNRVARWDGQAWQPLGTGADGTVSSLRAGPDGLYAGGLFNQMDTITALGLARWDGQRWCSLVPPGYFDLPTRAIGLFRDSLHIGGIFTTAGADSVYRVGVWSGGSTTSGCGPVGVQEEPTVTATTSLTAWPNPATDRVQVSGAPASARIELIDPLGRVVRRTTSEPAPLWVGDLPRGLYTIVVHERNGALHGRVRVRLDP